MRHAPQVVNATGTRRARTRGAPVVLACLALLGGCVSVELPTIAHVHVGHAITGWTDTPEGKGLCEVAQAEAAVATEHAAYAVEGARDPASVRLHLGHVLHAVDPSREASGPGSGYGLLKSLDGCIDHLGFAISVPDASANLKAGTTPLLTALQPLKQEARTVAAMALQARQSGDAALTLAFAQEVRQRSDRLLVGLVQARQRLSTVLAAEAPPYRTVSRHYLFGIIQLPSGDWAWASWIRQPSGSAHRH